MLMKWEDLEPGDVIRIRDGMADYYKLTDPIWVNRWCFRDLIVSRIIINGGRKSMSIYVDNDTGTFLIRDNGVEWWSPLSYCVLFKIVRLKDEEY